MQIIASLQKNLRSLIGLPADFAISASRPTAALGGSPPEVQLVRPAQVVAVPAQAHASAAAPVAARPTVRTVASPAHDTFKLYEEQLRLDFDLESKLALAQTPDASRQIRAAFAQFRASKLRGKTMADIAKEPFALRPTGKAATATVDDDGQTPAPATPDPENPAGIDGIISQLLDLVLELKKQLQVTADDDAETQAALGLFAAGKKLSASRALMAVTQKMCTRPKLSPRAKTARGFNSQPKVSALNSILSRRPGASPAPTVSTTPAVPMSSNAPAAASTSRDRVQAIRAEREALDQQMRKTGIYDAASLARQGKLKAELTAIMKSLRPQ